MNVMPWSARDALLGSRTVLTGIRNADASFRKNQRVPTEKNAFVNSSTIIDASRALGIQDVYEPAL